jgi:hypothetical protein
MSWFWHLLGRDWFVLLGAIAGVGLGCLPVIHHLVFGLHERRREIIDYFQPHSILLYFKQFYSGDWRLLAGKPETEIVAKFNEEYDSRFGVRTFLLPTSVYLLALLTLVFVIAFAIARGSPKWAGGALDIRELYALAGAYLWVILDLVSHYRQRDLAPSALYGYTFRFLISIPLAYALTAFLPQAAQPPVAFALGAFPTDTLMLILRRQAAQRLGLGEDTGTQKLELEALQGVNKTLAEKFGEIGIMTTLQLAYEDPIQLTMRTNLSFNFITDVVSQALAIIYGLDLTVTRPYSARGAFEASEVFEDYAQTADPEAKARADAVITQLAKKLEKPERIIQKILHDIHEDPYTQFLRAIWVDDDERVGSNNVANGIITSAESGVEIPQR